MYLEWRGKIRLTHARKSRLPFIRVRSSRASVKSQIACEHNRKTSDSEEGQACCEAAVDSTRAQCSTKPSHTVSPEPAQTRRCEMTRPMPRAVLPILPLTRNPRQSLQHTKSVMRVGARKWKVVHCETATSSSLSASALQTFTGARLPACPEGFPRES